MFHTGKKTSHRKTSGFSLDRCRQIKVQFNTTNQFFHFFLLPPRNQSLIGKPNHIKHKYISKTFPFMLKYTHTHSIRLVGTTLSRSFPELKLFWNNPKVSQVLQTEWYYFFLELFFSSTRVRSNFPKQNVCESISPRTHTPLSVGREPDMEKLRRRSGQGLEVFVLRGNPSSENAFITFWRLLFIRKKIIMIYFQMFQTN